MSVMGFLQILAVCLAVACAGCERSGAKRAAKVNEQEILPKLVEVNRYWLVDVLPGITNINYVHHRAAGSRPFTVADVSSCSPSRLRGVTYSSILQRLAHSPESVTLRKVEPDPAGLRLTLAFDPEFTGAIGNGVENSWIGYHTLSGTEGYVVLDPATWRPSKAGIGRISETYSNFVNLGPAHSAPLAIHLELPDAVYEWRFKVYPPGLWLFDEANSGLKRLAWIDHVRVNALAATASATAPDAAERDEAEKRGQGGIRRFLSANRAWLLPSLEDRRGLVYDYRQELPYRERIRFDTEGNILARLESSKESPDKPSLSRLWLADGRSYSGPTDTPFVQLNPAPGDALWIPEAWLNLDQQAQHVALGLAVDSAVTRLARDPGAFWAEVQPVTDQTNRYTMQLRSKANARLFAGTMLCFTSWCYMHDVPYDRSVVLCENLTHRPLVETNYLQTAVKGVFWYEDWMESAEGTAPGRIRAWLPLDKDEQDQALEMDARFGFVKPGVWMLRRVESRFRGTSSASTGTVTVVTAGDDAFQPISQLLAQARETESTLQEIRGAPEEMAALRVSSNAWTRCSVRARWSDQALQSVRDQSPRAKAPLAGVFRARLLEVTNTPTLEVEGVCTVPWSEFSSQWTFTFLDSQRRALETFSTNVVIRAEGGPGPFLFRLGVPSGALTTDGVQISGRGTVERLTGVYHGHGRWMRLMEPRKDG